MTDLANEVAAERATETDGAETTTAEHLSTLIYQYSLLPPVDGREHVEEMMRRAHRYQNDLVTIEQARRSVLRAAERVVGDVPACEAAFLAAAAESTRLSGVIKAARAKSRSRSETAPDREALKTARDVEREALRALWAARKAARETEEVKAVVAQVSGTGEEERGSKGGTTGALKRGARAISGLAWGSYARCEARADAARKSIDKEGGLWDLLEPNDPRRRRWDGRGFVGANQIAGGITVAELESGEDPRVRLTEGRPVRVAWDPAKREYTSVATGEPVLAHPEYKTIVIRVGKGDEARWCSWPIKLHRPLPREATVTEVVVNRQVDGPRVRWTCSITIRVDREKIVPKKKNGVGAMAVNLGWRLFNDGIRVAFWVADDGEKGEVRIPFALAKKITDAEDLRSIRDTHFDALRLTLGAWLKEHAAELPAWLIEATTTMDKWKSPDRAGRLAYRWRDQRFAGDEVGLALVESWRYRDRHLWQYESGRRAHGINGRRHFYRNMAEQLARVYGTVIFDNTDLSKLAKRPRTGDDDDVSQNEAARANRVSAAVSELRVTTKHRFARNVEVSCTNVTTTCHACGLINEFDAAAHVHHVCSGCGILWDQDENAARNILARGHEKLRDDKGPSVKPKGRSRFERAKIAGKERKEAAARGVVE